MLLTKQYELGAPLSELPPLTRKATGLIEFHCVLLTRNFLDAIGGKFDEGLRTTREHVDLCLLAELHGAEVYIEPASCVRYENSRPSRVADLDFFMFRWSKRATAKTISHFEEKWKIALEPQRQKIIARRRSAFLRELERNPSNLLYLHVWRRARRFAATKAMLRWANRNIL